MWRVAVIGSGSIVPDFLEAAAEVEELEIYAIFGRERSLEKLQRFQRDWNIEKIYHDYEVLLKDEQVDVVYIALPNHLHYAYAKLALEHGKHVIVEKPFASTYAEAKELAELAGERHVAVFEAISNQYLPNYLKTRELLPELGDVKIVQMNFSQYSRRYDQFKQGVVLPVFDPKQSGGALMDLNVYNIHYITGLFGKPDTVQYHANIERGIDTSGVLTMTYPGFQCVAIGAKDCRAPLSINVQGDRGYIHSDCAPNGYQTFVFGTNAGQENRYALNDGKPRLYFELQAFADMLKQGDPAVLKTCSRHTLEVMEILDVARQQAGIVF